MSYMSDPSLILLHSLRLKGSVDGADDLADHLCVARALSLTEIHRRLADLEEAGHARLVGGDRKRWILTRAGRDESRRLLSSELDSTGARDDVRAAYEAFGELNQQMLETCTRWQLRDFVQGRRASPVVNDHLDREYDQGVIEELRILNSDVQPICRRLAERLDRFSTYGPRFSLAIHRVDVGETDWFAKPGMDSYHSVWFELHEDLLATLGIERGAEETECGGRETGRATGESGSGPGDDRSAPGVNRGDSPPEGVGVSESP